MKVFHAEVVHNGTGLGLGLVGRPPYGGQTYALVGPYILGRPPAQAGDPPGPPTIWNRDGTFQVGINISSYLPWCECMGPKMCGTPALAYTLHPESLLVLGGKLSHWWPQAL